MKNSYKKGVVAIALSSLAFLAATSGMTKLYSSLPSDFDENHLVPYGPLPKYEGEVPELKEGRFLVREGNTSLFLDDAHTVEKFEVLPTTDLLGIKSVAMPSYEIVQTKGGKKTRLSMDAKELCISSKEKHAFGFVSREITVCHDLATYMPLGTSITKNKLDLFTVQTDHHTYVYGEIAGTQLALHKMYKASLDAYRIDRLKHAAKRALNGLYYKKGRYGATAFTEKTKILSDLLTKDAWSGLPINRKRIEGTPYQAVSISIGGDGQELYYVEKVGAGVEEVPEYVSYKRRNASCQSDGYLMKCKFDVKANFNEPWNLENAHSFEFHDTTVLEVDNQPLPIYAPFGSVKVGAEGPVVDYQINWRSYDEPGPAIMKMIKETRESLIKEPAEATTIKRSDVRGVIPENVLGRMEFISPDISAPPSPK